MIESTGGFGQIFAAHSYGQFWFSSFVKINAVFSLAEHTKQVAAGLMALKTQGFTDKMPVTVIYCLQPLAFWDGL